MSSKPHVTEKVPEADLFPPFVPDPSLTEEEAARRKRFYEAMIKLHGKLHLDIDIDDLRGRNRR